MRPFAAETAEAVETVKYTVENIVYIYIACKRAAPAAAETGVHSGLPELVITRPFVLVRKDFVSLVNLFKLLFRFLIARMEVRMVLFGKLAVRFFYFRVGGVFRHAHNLIIILISGQTNHS